MSSQNISIARMNIVYSVAVFPLSLACFYILLVAGQAQLLHLSLIVTTSHIANILSLLFLTFSISLILAYDIRKSPVARYFSLPKWYIGFYVAHCCTNYFLLILSSINREIVVFLGIYNIGVLILLLIVRPYRQLIDFIGILFNQLTVVSWMLMLAYKTYVKIEESIAMMEIFAVMGMLMLVDLLAVMRIGFNLYRNGWQGQIIKEK